MKIPSPIIIFIYNPIAGKANIASKLHAIVLRYSQSGYTLVPFLLDIDLANSYYKLIDLISDFKPKYILLAGGDGTINRYVNWALAHNINIPLAIIPIGTANDIAFGLGYKKNLHKNLDLILKGKEHKIDIAQANDMLFVNILSCGIFTNVSQNTPTILKNTVGKIAYFIGAISEITLFKKMHLRFTLEGQSSFEVKCHLLLIMNGRTAGNFLFAKNAEFNNGLLEVIIVQGKNLWATIGNIMHVLTKRKGNYPSDVIYFQVPSLRIENINNISVDLDGEKGSSFPLQINCLQNKLSIII